MPVSDWKYLASLEFASHIEIMLAGEDARQIAFHTSRLPGGAERQQCATGSHRIHPP